MKSEHQTALKERKARAGATIEQRIERAERASKAAGIKPRLTGTTYSTVGEDEPASAKRT